MLLKITTKHASYSLVTFVTHKRFAVLLRKLTNNIQNPMYVFSILKAVSVKRRLRTAECGPGVKCRLCVKCRL